MLTEIPNARQVVGEGRRRWFTDDYFDLIVWYGDEPRPIGFQLCYDKTGRERALTWTQDHGFRHDQVDAGEIPGHAKMTPIIVADGAFNAEMVSRLFRQSCLQIESGITDFVGERLDAYPAAG